MRQKRERENFLKDDNLNAGRAEGGRSRPGYKRRALTEEHLLGSRSELTLQERSSGKGLKEVNLNTWRAEASRVRERWGQGERGL